jgi:hypothetical protein
MRRHRLDAFGDDNLLAGGDVPLAPAIETVIGLDPAEQQILRAAGAENEAFDACDLHWGFLGRAIPIYSFHFESWFFID